MHLDVCVIITITETDSNVQNLLNQLLDLLNSEGYTHEIIILCNADFQEEWNVIKEFSSTYSAITVFLIKSHTYNNAAVLCGAMHGRAKYFLSLDSNFPYDARELLPLFFVIEKSNCEMVYGFTPAKSSRLVEPLRIAGRQIFAFFSGVSAFHSRTRIFSRSICKDLSVKTPYFFMFDRLLKNHIKNHTYIKLNNKRKILKNTNFRFSLKQLALNALAYSVLGEVICIILLSLNIIVLIKAKLLLALLIAVVATLLLWAIYLLKWRRRIAYKVVARF